MTIKVSSFSEKRAQETYRIASKEQLGDHPFQDGECWYEIEKDRELQRG